jgi:2-polyprenyl-6-methoxyphenol hydroxylase-like FAD-dependent oxidoreductase
MPDVVIAGAGPNGLMLASELALAGVRPLVLEARGEPATEPKANGLVGAVVRLLDRRGLYMPIAVRPGPPEPTPRFVFGAFPLELADLPANPLTIAPVPQRRLEEVLRDRAAELDVQVEWGRPVTGFVQDADGVRVEAGRQVQARFLVGADGGRSTVRRLAGIGFPGVTREDTVNRTVHATPPPEWLTPEGLRVPGYGLVPAFQHHRTERGLVVVAAMPGQPPLFSTVEWGGAVPEGPMTLSEMEESLRWVLGAEVPLGPPAGEGPFLLRRLTEQNTRVAERYRSGRVLLVGDAAHVHSGIGGPGLNLGLQDAADLGWKLAAELHGWAPPGLLDTYESERRAASERVVLSTQAQSALIAPGPEVTALRELMGELLVEPAVRGRIASLMAGTDVRRETGCAHPWAGYLAPELAVGGVPLTELTRGARPLLLDGTGALSVAGWEDRVDLVSGRLTKGAAGGPAAGVTALLLRPDCSVAWASSEPEPDPTAALHRWFGRRSALAVR